MSVPLGLLKHIRCPSGDACTSYRCLFRHAGDEEQWPLPPSAEPQAPTQGTLPGSLEGRLGRGTGHSASEPGADSGQLHAAATLRQGVTQTGEKEAPHKRVKLTSREDSGPTSLTTATPSLLGDVGADLEPHATKPGHTADTEKNLKYEDTYINHVQEAGGTSSVSEQGSSKTSDIKIRPDHISSNSESWHRPISPPPLKRKADELSTDDSSSAQINPTMIAITDSAPSLSTWWRSSSESPEPEEDGSDSSNWRKKPHYRADYKPALSTRRSGSPGSPSRPGSQRYRPASSSAAPQTAAQAAVDATERVTIAIAKGNAAGPLDATPTVATAKGSPLVRKNLNVAGTSARKSAVAVVKRKPEALNPRHVQKAPAKHETRLTLVKLLHENLKKLNDKVRVKGDAADKAKLLLSEQELIWLALDIEESFATSSLSKVYGDRLKHRVTAYRNMNLDQWKKERTEAIEKQRLKEQRQPLRAPEKQQSEALSEQGRSDGQAKSASKSTAAKKPEAASSSVDVESGLSPELDMTLLKNYLLTPIDKLARFGYVPKVPTDAEIQQARDADAVSKGWEQCDFCSQRFQVFPGRREEDGALASGGKCTHHPGRVDHARQQYRCCGESVQDTASLGCTVADHHRFKVKDTKRLASQWNFVETPANPDAPADRAVCFDCEMAYTVYGMEVVRLTATSWPGGELLLDVLVRPAGEIIDLNSQYSGVWPQDIADALPYEPGARPSSSKPLPIVSSPQAARDLFFSLIAPETPLIGHALENDLNILRVVHPTLVDTVLLFPHPRSLPVRYSLRALADTYLQRQIQSALVPNSDAAAVSGGHDSAEDARTAGDLVRLKVKRRWEDLQAKGWTVVDGTIVLADNTSARSL